MDLQKERNIKMEKKKRNKESYGIGKDRKKVTLEKII